MKNAFCFDLEALFFLKIFKFLSQLFGNTGKMAWFRKIRRFNLVYNQLHAIHVSPSISQSKSNQTMKYVQLIEYN